MRSKNRLKLPGCGIYYRIERQIIHLTDISRQHLINYKESKRVKIQEHGFLQKYIKRNTYVSSLKYHRP